MLERTLKLKITSIYIGIKVFGTIFALFVFNRFTPLIDSINYVNNFYLTDIHYRTLVIQYITNFLVSLTTPLVTHIIFSLFSGSAILYYALKSKKNSWLLLILLFPSALTWTSIVGKEAIYFGCVGIFLILWIDLIKEKLSYRHLSLTIPLGLCAILRPHYTISLLWLAFSALIIKNNMFNFKIFSVIKAESYKEANNRVIILLFITTIFGIAYLLMPELTERGYSGINAMARASRNLTLNLHTLEAFKSHISTGMLFGIIGPLPSELLRRPEFLPFFIEGIVILIAPFAIGFILFNKTQETKSHIYFFNFIYGVVPAIIILLLVHAPFGILNPGSAIRWRVNFELIFYMAPLLLFLEAKKMTTNIHFHPDGLFSKKFVQPLIDAERAHGNVVKFINSSNAHQGEIQIPYNLELKNIALLPFSFIKIILILLKQKPDYIVTHNTRSSLLPLLVANLLKVPHTVYFNHGVPYLGYRGIVRLILLLIERVNCCLASDIITVSKDMQAALTKITSKTVSIISNGSSSGINLNQYSKKKYENSSFRSDYGIRKSDFVCIFNGRPEVRKGYNFTLELWTKYFKDLADCKLIICGSDEANAKKVIKDIPENIIFMGFCNNMPEILSKSDCLILPSLHEGLSYSVLEALASECIVLSNDIQGVRELITNEGNGFLLSGNNYIEYFNKIILIKNNRTNLQVMANAGLKTALKYSRPIHIKEYIKYMNSMTKNGNKIRR